MAVSLQASVAHVMSKLLARRATSQEEIPVLMRVVEDTVRALTAPPPRAEIEPPAPAPEALLLARVQRVRRPRKAAPPAAPEPAVVAPQPRLVRRADVVTPQNAEPALAPRLSQSSRAIRGIVKWFDQRTRRGALRLPGLSEDAMVEASLLDDMGLTRLYKGQEIEASLSEDGSRVVRLGIPGGLWQVHPTGGVVRNRHHARPVVVEMKREALRRVAARVEAEQLLGPTRAR